MFRHQRHKSAEVVIGIMGSWTGFGVVLHSENGLMTMGEGGDGAVVEIEMGHLHAVRR